MTGPVVPPGGELRARLLEALCLSTPPCQDHLDDLCELLPVVEELLEAEGRRRAAEEIERLADSLTDRVRTWVLNLLRDRAAALAPENARPE